MARGLIATFPDLGLHVDEVYWMGNDRRMDSPCRCAGRRSEPIAATASTAIRPDGAFTSGACPSCTFGHGQIVEEWTLFNEFDVLAQLLRDEPAGGQPTDL